MASRRGNSEGTFYKRDDGRWEGKVRITDPRGKSRRVSAYGPTRKAAKAALDEVVKRQREGLALVDSKSPLADVARKWRTTTLIASDRRQATKELYDGRSRLHIETGVLADIPLARLSPSDIEEWIVAAREAGVSDSSLRTDYAVLRAILDTAVRDGMVAKNVAAQVDRPSLRRKEALHLTPAQVNQLLEATAHSRHALPIRLEAATGLRRGEVLALRWRDVNLVERTISVAGTMTGQGKKLRREPMPKTKSGLRVLPISPDMTELLRTRRDQQEAEQRRAQASWDNPEGLVFTTEFGHPIDGRNMLRTLKKAALNLGLPKETTLHTLRHSAATALLDSGVHIKLVSAILGHSDISITADIYGHAPDAAQRAALDALDAQVSTSRHLHPLPSVDSDDEPKRKSAGDAG
ncbi:tyrosine-type recombinase/integrase [Mycolicibacterium conceptionense]|uniref:tyrosine-type recombinase/integrase n=1 Tax=Mycolicibacterium conceptionense TaxID=451644 RepID=UPI000662618F|nr:site-specific integrase [Mycolicibacterium conceptionense]